jgi:hypothetical protein
MRLKKPVWRVVLLFLLLLASPAAAEVDMQVTRTLNLDQAPLATEVAPDGSYIYVLTHGGKLQIYSAAGQLDDTLEVGTHIDGIKTGPNANLLFLTSSSKKTVDIVNLTFVKNIPIEGSPFKGKADAPVALVVFSDFQ